MDPSSLRVGRTTVAAKLAVTGLYLRVKTGWMKHCRAGRLGCVQNDGNAQTKEPFVGAL